LGPLRRGLDRKANLLKDGVSGGAVFLVLGGLS
jgi:hypothetical protein